MSAEQVADNLPLGMTKIRTLFGKKLLPHHMLNFSEQLYDILVREIELGRWQLNERLPGVIQLARELDFGTKTIQTAYDRLKREGYVRALGYRGTFLKSRHPQASAAAGKLGVLISPEDTDDPLTLWYQHVILQTAKKRNLIPETKVLPVHLAAADINRRGRLFGDDVLGILSLTPWQMAVRFGEAEGALPVAFLLPPFAAGIFSEDSVEPDPRQSEMHRRGYLQAMRENDMETEESLLCASQSVNNNHLSSVTGHLREILRKGKSAGPIAVVAGSLGRAMALSRAALAEGVRIPEELGIVSIGSAPVEGDPHRQITGMLPDFDAMTEMCMEMIQQQRDRGRSDFTEVKFRMHFIRGHTLACHGADPFLFPEQLPENILSHDPASLSRAVANSPARSREKR
ncbi:MAG: GntR family transcriptional regulator [Verrucomicrobia bacterium]|nr:GntR family transcriptional regulator [Verrucomicrobiota bacterium]